jgi:hypothetical protein
MGAVIRRALAHIAPEELLLIPVVIIVALAIIAQPTSITRLFETPFATPIPGDSPADLILGDRSPTPAPAPSPATVPGRDVITISGTRPFTPSVPSECPTGSTLRVTPARFQDGSTITLLSCVGADGSILQWDTTSTRLRPIPGPGSITRP